MIDLETTINELRLLVFIETSPQSNKYNQVILNSEQFKKVSNDICVELKPDTSLKDDFEMGTINQSEEEYQLPDLQSYE